MIDETKPREIGRNEARRQQILTAAADCFTRRGFHGASMAEVAKAAGMSVGHVYHYFENKEAIVTGIVEEEVDRLLGMFDALRCEQDVLKAVLDQANRDFLDGTKFVHGVLAVEVVAEATRNPKIAEVLQRIDLRCRTRLRDLVSQLHGGTLGEDELDGRVEVAAALFDGLKVRAVRNPQLNRDAMAPILRATLKSILQ